MAPIICALALLCHPSFDVTGAWQGHDVELFVNGYEAAYSPSWKVDLKSDDSFTWHMESHVMYDVTIDATGTYTVSGSRVDLNGNEKSVMNDGHGHTDGSGPFKEYLTVREQELWLTIPPPTYPDGKPIPGVRAMKVVFARPGVKPVIPADLLQKPMLKPSDPKAVSLARQIEARYASLSSYADDGTMTSDGEGFKPKSVKFHTRFLRPSEILFDAFAMEGKKVVNHNSAWSDGKTGWLYMSDVGGKAQRPIGNALSILTVTSGSESMFVPSLLIPKAFSGHTLSDFKQVMFGKPVTWNGKKCLVLDLTNSPGATTRIWIEASSRTILAAHYQFSNEDVIFNPRLNPKLAAAEFKPKL